ncbi:hypothetical protein MMC28_010359 [Mycoblastus sanguinarius]|nr:hypothetical protein [Mycoblastus sanguinarius]
MDDLSSLDWAASKAPSTNQQHPPGLAGLGNYYPALRPTPPLSGRSTPSAPQATGGSQKPPINATSRSNTSTPANDSFANLVAFSGQQTRSLSLQEQRMVLQEERTKKEAEKRKHLDAHFGTGQAASWDSLGDGRTTPNRITSPPTYTATDEYGGQKLSKIINKPFAGIPSVSYPPTTRPPVEDEDDLLAAFNASAPVDNSSYMPAISDYTSNEDSNLINGSAAAKSSSTPNIENATNGGPTEDLDDDSFGLGTASYKNDARNDVVNKGAGHDDDDDVLGLLSRPVSEFSQQQAKEQKASDPSNERESNPQDRAIAELVDMGFASEKSRRALEATESGTDVQAAVGWLLNQAHEESRKKSQTQHQENGNSVAARTQQSRRAPGRRKSSDSGSAKPVWMREQDLANSSQRRPDSRSPVNGERDPSQYAAEIGNKMFKTANSLWKTGAKRLNQAVSELNSDSDSSQPKWMRDAPVEAAPRKSQSRQIESDIDNHDRMARRPHDRPAAHVPAPDVTDEALMLEADARPPQRSSRTKAQAPPYLPRDQPPKSVRQPQEQAMPQPKFMQQVKSGDVKAKLSRQAIEEETSQAYISPARRKKSTPNRPPPAPEPEPDQIFNSAQTSPKPASSAPQPKPPTQSRVPQSTSLPTRPPSLKRAIPPVSSTAVQTSKTSRQAGTSAFKRGDYALATTNYTASLSALPSAHPLTIPLLTNRSLAHLKTGDPKASVADAIAAVNLIGPSRGAGETIDLGSGEGLKPMGDYWGKAMTREAEALEQLERWSDAAAIWKSCVEAGVGGATSIASRSRCEKAAAGPSQHKPSAAPRRAAPKPRPNASALSDLAPNSAQSAEAISRLRAANAAADRLDDEKFALADQVDSRISNWRRGKEGNLRALLSTLENVLWEGSGWMKVGMGDLLLPGKVKINYMKGIGKVHPDKVRPEAVSVAGSDSLPLLPITATTEQKMVSAAVFATLNEAWERFKQENGL